VLDITIVDRLNAVIERAGLMLIYAIFYPGSPQKSPQSSRSRIVLVMDECCHSSQGYAAYLVPAGVMPVCRPVESALCRFGPVD
jgi:hypothetical protein